jgi:flagellar biosynthesis protein FliR
VIAAPSAEIWVVAFARASAFAATAPLAGSGAVPKALRAVLALVLTPAIVPHVLRSVANERLYLGALENATIGAAFGIAAAAIASAASSAGAIVDATLASTVVQREAVFGGAGGPFGRMFALAFATMFLGSGALTHLCERFVSASSDSSIVPTLHGAVTLVRATFSNALALAGPALVAQLLGTVVAASAARAAPRVNGLMLSSPLVTSLLLLSMLVAAPPTLIRLVALAREAAVAPPL